MKSLIVMAVNNQIVNCFASDAGENVIRSFI
jgi:hypothetical protein